MVTRNELPDDFALSAGCAHFPTDAADPDAILRLADARQYDAKRAKPD
jgi:GGDEF domain-containing protein